MLVYGAVIVVAGQLTWYAGLKTATAGEVSLANSFNPVAGILAAYLILGEVPTFAQYIGGAVIIGGIILNQVGVMRSEVKTKPSVAETEMSGGFKGV